MNIIEIKNLTKQFGDFKAVDDISIDIEKNSIVGFVGKNGAGKTTTIRCMLDFIKPTSGSVKIKGIDSTSESIKIKAFTGYMPGDTSFYDNMSCMDIFKLSCKISGVGIEEAKKYAEYFELDTSKKFRELSLGNKKKVSIIQSLLKDIEVLILDEPTNGLDPLMQMKFFELIMELKKKGVTVFLSSHNLSDIEKYCDRVIIIKDGKIIEDLNMDEIVSNRKQIVSYVTSEGKSEEFSYDGDINELIKKLSKLELTHIEIRNSSVEDEFIRYYKER